MSKVKVYTITRKEELISLQKEMKQHIHNIVVNALIKEFGSENVAMIRTYGGSIITPHHNELCVLTGKCIKNGEQLDLCQSISFSSKNPEERLTCYNQRIPGFNFLIGKEEYNKWDQASIQYQEDKKKKISSCKK